MIVVGVDGSEGSERAVRWAVAEAHLRSTPVVLVHAWSYALGGHAAEAHTLRLLEDASQALLDAAVESAAAAAPPGVAVSGRLVSGTAARSLVEASHDADVELVVVGSRGHGTIASLVLGSVAEACVRHCRCPVVVVPGEPDQR